MKYLQVLLDNKYWIMFVAVLLLPIIGWWPATGALNADIATQNDKIKAAFQAIPNSSLHPNAQWKASVDQLNATAESLNKDAEQFLWNRQEQLMVWPKIIRPFVPAEFRGSFPTDARAAYKREYVDEVEKVWKAADPFDEETGEGTIMLDQKSIPSRLWGNLPPSSEDMWDEQEDLWLLEALLKAIKKTNADATNITDATVRQIGTIQLAGGEGDYPDAEDIASSDGGGYSSEYDGGYDGEYDGGGGGYQDAGGQGASYGGNVGFDVTEEFGVEQGRYIDYTEDAPFRRRGFYIEVLMDVRQIPKLLTNLSDCPWTVSIKRYQWVKSNGTALSVTAGNTGSGGPGGSYSEGGGGYAENYNSQYSDQYESQYGNESNYPQGGGRSGLPNAQGLAPGFQETQSGAQLAASAVKGAFLAQVAICGEMVLYNPLDYDPEAIEAAAEAEAQSDQANPDLVQPEPATQTENADPAEATSEAANTEAAPATPEMTEEAGTPTEPVPADPATPPATPEATTPEASP